MTGYAWESFITRLLDVGLNAAQGLIRIALLIVLAYVLTRLLRAGLNRLEILLIRATEKTETIPGAAGKRIKTLTGVLWTIGCGLLWFVVVLVTFSQIGFNIGPILAGAGVAGLAVGFGAQHLVRDLVSGFFLLLENQIRIGDTAIVNGTGGLVEAITFRTVVLRDQAGDDDAEPARHDRVASDSRSTASRRCSKRGPTFSAPAHSGRSPSQRKSQ